MNMSALKSLAASAAVALSLASQASAQDCKPAHTFDTINKGILTISTWNYPPFSIADADGNLTGVDADIVQGFAEKECLQIKYEVVDSGAVIQYVVSAKSDMAMGNWYRVAKRAQVVNVSAPTYVDKVGIISKDGFTGIDKIAGKRIGSVDGYNWNPDLKAIFGEQNVVLYPSPVGMAQDLVNGRIEVGFDSYAYAAAAQKGGGYQGMKISIVEPDERLGNSIKPIQAGFPYSKGNTALGEALDDYINELVSSGGMAKILEAYELDRSMADVGEPYLAQ